MTDIKIKRPAIRLACQLRFAAGGVLEPDIGRVDSQLPAQKNPEDGARTGEPLPVALKTVAQSALFFIRGKERLAGRSPGLRVIQASTPDLRLILINKGPDFKFLPNVLKLNHKWISVIKPDYD